MTRIGYWTPAYAGARLAEMHYQKTHPDHPWLTREANHALETLLKPSDVGLEFGSGRSTIWLAARVKKLTSVEHDKEWHSRVTVMLENAGLTNIDYRFNEADNPDGEAVDFDAPYVAVTKEFPEDSLDFCLVDGAYRSHCAMGAIPNLKPGGILIIDKVNRYLPNNSAAPQSRSMEAGPLDNGVWREVASALQGWRHLWTSSGVTDTAIFFKPCG